MRKYFRIASLLLVCALLFGALAACGNDAQSGDADPGTEDDAVTDNAGNDVSSSFTGDGAEGSADGEDKTEAEPEVVVDPDPQFDGVYMNGDDMIVIRYADSEICDLIISMGVDGENAYVSGIGQIDGNNVLFQTETLAVTMNLNFDELVVTEEGSNNYYAPGFAGTYTRNDTDPYSVQVRQTTGGNIAPDTTGYAIINGERAVVYLDPENRFTATVPDIFSHRPEDKQPDDGIYFGSLDDDVYAIIQCTDEGGITAERLKENLEDEYGVEADLFVSGLVTIQYSYEDGDGQEWICVVYAIVVGEDLARVDYCYLASQADYYGSLLDQVSINVS